MPEARPSRPLAAAGALLGAAGVVASVALLYVGMRDVMVEAGGFCARGGPYVIANECSDEQIGYALGGVAGLWVSLFLYIGCAARAGWNVLSGGLLLWAVLFGALGWNFLELGLDPPGDRDVAWGWVAPGVVFWLMALPGLYGLVGLWRVLTGRGAPERPPWAGGRILLPEGTGLRRGTTPSATGLERRRGRDGPDRR